MTTPDRYRFALSPDGAQFAVWEPGQESWVVHSLPSPREGGWVPVTEMDRLGWTVFVPVPVDRNALRQRIAEALYAHNHPGWATGYTDLDQDEQDTYLARADAVLAVLPEPTGQTTDQAAILERAADVFERDHTVTRMFGHQVAAELRRLADDTPAAPEDGTRTADLIAESATEYRVPVPEGGGTNLIVRRQGVAFGAGWSVAVPGWGGGRAWTAEGWQDSISALTVDRLFCWPDADTAVTEARRALAARARQDGAQQQEAGRD